MPSGKSQRSTVAIREITSRSGKPRRKPRLQPQLASGRVQLCSNHGIRAMPLRGRHDHRMLDSLRPQGHRRKKPGFSRLADHSNLFPIVTRRHARAAGEPGQMAVKRYLLLCR